MNVQVIGHDHAAYPPLLHHIHTPPRRLYVRGDVSLLSYPALIAVVGSRKANTYGYACCRQLLPPLIAANIILVSGLAYGIDAEVHRLSVVAHKPTIAVVGSGVDDASLYPQSHRSLAADILRYGGAIISEYPEGTPPLSTHFPARNRIIAGMTRATIVIQAATKSGSLITARLAVESNRDVYAVPGPINDPLSAGTNALILAGATPLITAQTFLDTWH